MGLGIGQLGREEAPLGVEDLDVARIAVVIAEPGDAGVFLQGVDLPFLRLQLLAGAPLIDEGVIDLAESRLYRALVAEERLLLDGFRCPELSQQGAAREDRGCDRSAPTPHLRGAVEEVGCATRNCRRDGACAAAPGR